jgi:hypothetical protein
MEIQKHKNLFFLLAFFCLASVYFFTFFVDQIPAANNDGEMFEKILFYKKTTEIKQEVLVKSKYAEKPETVRGIYVTAHSANNENFRKRIIEKYNLDGINSLVIDIKDYTGFVLYDSKVEDVKVVQGSRDIFDIQKVVDEFHEAGFYLIARQTVFQDPVLSQKRPDLALKGYNGKVWREYSGLSWMDPSFEEVWEYNLKISKEAVDFGFDEINFDYVRYPSDGNLETLNYNLKMGESKALKLQKFYEYMYSHLSGLTKVSFDFFGMTMDYPDGSYDLGIGQRNLDVLNNADFVSPMMYPSHYPDGYLGLSNPADFPYAVIRAGLDKSIDIFDNQKTKVRPWIQAFHIGAYYNQYMIKEQVRAVEESDYTDGWLLWNAANKYPDYIFDIFEKANDTE